jgi:hypothetical protein
MNNKKMNVRWAIVALIILVAVCFRFVPHLLGDMAFFNFNPIGAMALFGGAYFARKHLAFLFPLAALWVSNIIIDNVFFSEYYEGFTLFANWEIYLTVALIVGLGILLLKKISIKRVFVASLSASVLFFVVSNFLVWTSGTMYPMTFAGLIDCYVMAIPFFGPTVASDLFFVTVLFGGFELVKAWKPNLAFQTS